MMTTKRAKPFPASSTLTFFLLAVAIAQQAAADMDQDRSECATQLVGLATCLPYVGGEAKAPTVDCCTGLKQVLKQSQKCLCILIKDRDDPSLGLKINGTLAATLPSTCHVPSNVSNCINLLHLSPNSTDAKMFKEFSNIDGAKTNSTSAAVTSGSSTATGSKAKDGSSSDAVKVGGKGKWMSTSWPTSSLSVILGSLIVWTFTSFVF